MPSNVDVIQHKNPFYPHIYDTLGFSMEILMNNLYVYFSFTGSNSYFMCTIGLKLIYVHYRANFEGDISSRADFSITYLYFLTHDVLMERTGRDVGK
jgi:hypothetical protein